jgi:O-antigen ligase
MGRSWSIDGPARAGFFALLPAAAAGGAMALPVLLALAGIASLRVSQLRQVIGKMPIAVSLLLAFIAWAAISTLWSPYPVHDQAYKLAALIPLGLVFVAGAQATARLTRAAVWAAFAVLAALLLIEALFGLPLNHAAQPHMDLGLLAQNGVRGVVVLLGLTWAAAAGLLAAARPGWARATLIASAVLALQFDQLANFAAAAAGLIAFALAFAAPRFTLLASTWGLAAWMLAAPFVTPLVLANQKLVDALPLSWASRAGIWEYVCARIVEQPWIGHGLDASRAVTDRIQVRELDMRGVPLHPHSASLHVWFETGAVGAALAAAALVAGGWSLSRALSGDRPTAAAAAATFASFGLIANVSFGTWQEWWIATMFVAAAACASVSAARTHAGPAAPCQAGSAQ